MKAVVAPWLAGAELLSAHERTNGRRLNSKVRRGLIAREPRRERRSPRRPVARVARAATRVHSAAGDIASWFRRGRRACRFECAMV